MHDNFNDNIWQLRTCFTSVIPRELNLLLKSTPVPLAAVKVQALIHLPLVRYAPGAFWAGTTRLEAPIPSLFDTKQVKVQDMQVTQNNFANLCKFASRNANSMQRYVFVQDISGHMRWTRKQENVDCLNMSMEERGFDSCSMRAWGYRTQTSHSSGYSYNEGASRTSRKALMLFAFFSRDIWRNE